MTRRVAVIGGGAAGQMAAMTAAKNGAAVTLFEKNEKLGKKIYITGKGRCNLTNDCGRDGFFENVIRNPRFLYSAYAAFDQKDIMAFMESHGTPVKVERGQRVFPESDKASDVMRALERGVREAGVTVKLNERVSELLTKESEDGKRRYITGLVSNGVSYPFDSVILATGGVSYPSTGSTGEGLLMAQKLGHTITPLFPSLVPLETAESWPKTMPGITLKNVELTVTKSGKTLYRETGEMLLTHFGVSGPLILTASAYLAGRETGAVLYLDFKPGIPEEELRARIDRELAASPKKSVESALGDLLPVRLFAAVLKQAGVDGTQRSADMNRQSRQALIQALKHMPLTVKQARPFTEAVVTRGGIPVKEVDASTMASKLVPGLFFAGEMLDTDAFTGGFNLQIAWSTGVLAGQNV